MIKLQAYHTPVINDGVVRGAVGIYAHGALEDALQHDVLYTPCTLDGVHLRNIMPEGENDVMVVLPDGTEIPAKAFVWSLHPCSTKGLVVVGEGRDYAYAKNCYENKEMFI